MAVAPALHAQDLGGDLSLHKLLHENEEWQLVVEDLGFADAPCADQEGNFYYSDMRSRSGLYKRSAHSGAINPLFDSEEFQGISGMKFGPDGRLFACQGRKKRVIAISVPDGEIEVLAENVQPNDLAVTSDGHLYFTETRKQQITHIDLKTKKVSATDTGRINAPNGITLSPAQDTLAVSDYRGLHVWAYRIEKNGSLTAPSPYMTMRTNIEPEAERVPLPTLSEASGGDGMTMDATGRYYVATAIGVQVFDPTGRECGLILKPQDGPMTSVCLGGPDGHWLFATCKDKIFRLKVKAKGI